MSRPLSLGRPANAIAAPLQRMQVRLADGNAGGQP